MEFDRFVLKLSLLVLLLASLSLTALAFYPGPAGIVLLGALGIVFIAAVAAYLRGNR